jgi:hypothetical protein
MFVDEVIQFLSKLEYQDSLSGGISIMNPSRDDPKIIPLEHHGYIMQYKSKQKSNYFIRYLEEL